MPKFLLIQTAFIGDVVLATGMIEKLHEFYPDAQIDFLVRKGNEQLLTGHPFLNEVLVWDKKKDKLFNLWDMLKVIRKTRYDKVINLQRFAATGILTAFSGAKETIGFDKNPFSGFFTKKIKHVIASGRHEVERNHELIKDITDAAAVRPRLYPQEKDFEFVKQFQQQPYITVAPASVWFTKQYPKEKWISFIEKIPRDQGVILLGAPSDKVLCEEIIKGVRRQAEGSDEHVRGGKAGVRNLAGQLTLLQSAALMKGAVMNYVNDSAPMHFASAMNAPVTAVYCSTVPDFGFGPLSDVSFIVQKDEPLYCRPCGLHGYQACPEKHFRCAFEIKDEHLIESLQQNHLPNE